MNKIKEREYGPSHSQVVEQPAQLHCDLKPSLGENEELRYNPQAVAFGKRTFLLRYNK